MKIAIVQGAFLPVPPRMGGAVEKVWYALGREFAHQGHTVTHVSRKFVGLPHDEYDAGVHYLRVSGYSAPKRLWQLKAFDLLYSLRVSWVLPRADILVTNTFWLPLIERRKTRGRLFVHVARYPRGQFRFYPQRAVFQTVSSPIRKAILEEVPTAARRVCVVPYPVSPSYLVPHNQARERAILYAGRIHPEKGLHLLIDSFVQATNSGLRGWTLRIVGPWATEQGGGGENYRLELAQRAARCADAVEFLGPVFDELALIDHYRRAAFFVYPSLAERGETFGLAVLEAMAAGCPPIVSNLECFRDFVQDGLNGLIFDHRAENAADQLATLLSRLAHEPERLSQIGAAARTTAERYSLSAIANRYIEEFFTPAQ
jgi:glycosyltransferase involved in cell wall biosynthesis